MAIRPFLSPSAGHCPRAAVFLSGSGSNAERLLEDLRVGRTVPSADSITRVPSDSSGAQPPYRIAALVTDAPASSRAVEIGTRFAIPVVANDIRAFYREHGETRVTLATPRGRELRERWTQQLRGQLAPFQIDFGILAGFVPLSNITGDFPCLNVHPGDLTHLKNGQRYLVGLHTVPIERAILEGLDHLRSSVIVALPYTGRGDDMDNGPILGISEPVPIELSGSTVDELRAVAARRPAQRPPGGYGDRLEEIARLNQDRLKRDGDWVVLPKAVRAFAQGDYGTDEAGQLFLRRGDAWQPIKTVVFSRDRQQAVC